MFFQRFSLLDKDKNISSREITRYTRQLATMTMAGIPLAEGLRILISHQSNKQGRKIFQTILVSIENGLFFSKALCVHKNYFDAFFLSLIETGENTGNLDHMLDRIATYREKKEQLQRELLKALIYPAMIVCVSLLVCIVMLLKVIPIFESLFQSFHLELPVLTQLILRLSRFIQDEGVYYLLGLIGFIFCLFKLYRQKPSFQKKWHRALLKLPTIGPFIQDLVLARFTRTLATTVSANLPLTDCLALSAKTTDHPVYVDAMAHLTHLITSGQPLSHAMEESQVFPRMIIEMIHVAEESGKLEAMLNKIAALLETKTETIISSLSNLIEPFVMILLGIVVGTLIIAMYLPIFQIGSMS